MGNQSSRYYRKVSQNVLRWYFECESGIIQTDKGPVFDERVLNYRVDVELALRPFDRREVEAVMLIHRDGLTHAQALGIAGITVERPDKAIDDIETRIGQAFERKRLSGFLTYVEHLR